MLKQIAQMKSLKNETFLYTQNDSWLFNVSGNITWNNAFLILFYM